MFYHLPQPAVMLVIDSSQILSIRNSIKAETKQIYATHSRCNYYRKVQIISPNEVSHFPSWDTYPFCGEHRITFFEFWKNMTCR